MSILQNQSKKSWADTHEEELQRQKRQAIL